MGRQIFFAILWNFIPEKSSHFLRILAKRSLEFLNKSARMKNENLMNKVKKGG